MKTSESVKAVIVAVTTLGLVGTLFGTTILSLNDDEYVSENRTVLMDSELNIKPAVASYEKKMLKR